MTTHHHRPLRLLVGLLAAAALALGVAALPAAAHEGTAVVVIEAAHPAGTSVHYIVRVTWEDDGHPATDATVTATAVGGDGTQLTPVTLPAVDDDGRYAGVVEYPSPGTWTVRITSIDPTGSAEQEQVVTPSPTTEPPGDDSAGTTVAGEDGFAPAADDTGASAEQAASEGSGGGGMPVLMILVAAVVVIAGAVAAISTIRRHQPGKPGPGPDDGPSGDDDVPPGGASTPGDSTPGEPAATSDPTAPGA